MQKFNDKFIFSTSTCSFQVEGGRKLGGREYSIWDKYTIDNFHIPKPGAAEREIASIEVASDFYHRYKEDAKIMSSMGVNGFVYNMDWARIFPNNKDEVNEEGLQWYEDVFKELVKNNVKPIPILYHWDTPLWLEKQGGTASREFVYAFQNFVKVVFEKLGKYTDIWYVNDENSSYSTLGYLESYFPPAKSNKKEFLHVLHNLNLSAALAKVEFNKAKQAGLIEKHALIGIDHDWNPAVPYDVKDKDDLKACEIFNEYNLDLFLDPNLKGTYPDCFYKMLDEEGIRDEVILEGDMNLLKDNILDLIGWNYYRPAIIAHPKRLKENIIWYKKPDHFITKQAFIVYPKSERYTKWNWLIKPDQLVPGAEELYKRYERPLMIIENGIGFFDKKENRTVRDDYRIEFLNEHLHEVQKAVDKGIPFIGYSLWTYSDIFSPSGGYRKKYGLVGVDFEGGTLDRFPKSSYYWYKDIINKKSTPENKDLTLDEYHKQALTWKGDWDE